MHMPICGLSTKTPGASLPLMRKCVTIPDYSRTLTNVGGKCSDLERRDRRSRAEASPLN